jgi:nucleoside-diphosphate-sugar epimerase
MDPAPAPADRRALVFGARGQIGHFLLPRLRAAGVAVDAVTRGAAPPPTPGVRWHSLELFGGADFALAPDWIFSCGPLDGFVAWLERSALRPARVVAFSSTSADSKQDSADPAERALAARLQASERRLETLAHARAVHVTLLRPTLVYGAGRDRNLSRIARLAQRWGVFVLPRSATGLRQPVHAEDLALAALQSATGAAPPRLRYDLPGGETMTYREMVRRVLDALQPTPRLLLLPDAPVRVALRLAHAIGALGDARAATLQRLHRDLVFDAAPACRELGFAPRPFRPRSEMFVAGETM